MDLLAYLHLTTPALLSLPFFTLLPAPPEELPELPGIRPITIRTVTPRRSYTLLCLSLLALSSALDAAVLIARIATSDKAIAPSGWPLAAEVGYAFGGLFIWALTAIVIEWRTRWGDQALIVLGALGLVCEIPNLVLLVLRKVHTSDKDNLFNILPIPPSALRLVLLPILLVLVSNPIVRYEPASESTGLLNGQSDHAESSNRQAPAYGTFSGETGGSSTKSTRVSSPTAGTGGNGAATPAPGQQSIIIPKKLGEAKKDDKSLSWREIAGRLRKLAPHLWPSTSRKLQFFVVLCLIFVLITRVANPLVPLALGGIVQSLTEAQAGNSATPVWFYFGSWIGLRYLVGGRGVISSARDILWVPVSQYTDRKMQMLCFDHLLNLSLAYHTKRNTGEVLKIIDRGSAINNLFQTVLFTAIPTVFDMVISFGVFYYLYGGMLACLMLLIMSVYVVFSVLHTNWRMKERRIMIERDVKARGIVSDVLTNWESVKYFTAESRESRRFQEAILSYQETERKVQVGFSLLALIQYFIMSVGITIGSLIIAFRILEGRNTPATFVVFVQYYIQLQGPLDQFGWLYRILNSQTTDAEKMFTLLAQETEVKDKPDAKELVVTDGVIEFDNVVFSYDGKVEALKGVSFTIGKGESMALVGESGSGKSTILRLLYRFYDITSGSIRIDGQDIATVTQLSLRRAIGIVPQDSVLWNDTIGANIAYGKEGADDEEIIAAAKAARMHDRILGFPDQYSTIVGERGVRLSGGEKQRTSIARMFLKSPAILVLDEATNALDTETEREIQKALADLAKGRSSLSIAHRLSTIINSDQIVVMKDGQIVERGGYKELVDRDGAFAKMWKKQIFTEAEMVAQLEGVSTGEIAKTLPKEEDLIKLVDGPEAGSSRRSSLGRVKEESTQGGDSDVEVTKGEESKGFQVGDEGAEGNAGTAAVVEADVTAGGASETQPISAEPREVQDPFVDPEVGAIAEPVPATETTDEPALTSTPIPDILEPKSQADEASEPASSETTATPTPERPSPNRVDSSGKVPFPQMPRMTSSTSQRSDLSASAGPSSSPSASNNPSSTDLPEMAKDDKRRKRLSSLKGFVRRISDQGVSRSNSLNKLSASPRASPAEEVDEATALMGGKQGEEKRKKRLSLGRGKSDK